MRIVSLQPSVTATLVSLGALNSGVESAEAASASATLVACTRYCQSVCPQLAQHNLAIIEDSWSADTAQISALHPDLVIASVPYRTESLAAILRAGIRVVALAPKSLADVYADIRLLASLVQQPAAGENLVGELQNEITRTRETIARENTPRVPSPPQRVFSEAWGKPLIASQPWVAELVASAGGVSICPAGEQTTAEAIAAADPDVIFAAWCGAADRVPLGKLAERPGWAATNAVRNRRLFCVADELFNTPASHTLIGGLHAIRWALHPTLFPRPAGIRGIDEEASLA
jgi:iron complex transport system substrate-binding protein